MKRTISSLLLASCALGVAQFSPAAQAQGFPLKFPTNMAQAQLPNGLYYTFYGQQVPLTLRQDTIAVAFKNEAGGTRGGATVPLHLQLQRDLARGAEGTRGSSGGNGGLQLEVKPLGKHYALVTLPAGGTRGLANVSQAIQQQSYVENTLPVVSRSDRDEKIVLTNEIVLSFEPGLSESQKQAILLNNNLEVVNVNNFSANRYLVRTNSASGVAVLNVANRLNEVSGVRYATPNFVQTVNYQLR